MQKILHQIEKKKSLKYLLLILNGFLTLVPTKLSSILHSHGENRETRNKTMLTPKQANIKHVQISWLNGDKKENRSLDLTFVRFIIIEIPARMKGTVKSTTCSLKNKKKTNIRVLTVINQELLVSKTVHRWRRVTSN